MEFENQHDEAMKNLLAIQELLGGLGFTLTGDNAYYKDYALIDGGIVRVTPVFDRGMSLNTMFNLVGFNLATSKFVPIDFASQTQIDGTPVVPAECRSDISIIVGSVGPMAHKPMVENFMITAVCGECGTDSSSFMRINGRDTCLKCLGHT